MSALARAYFLRIRFRYFGEQVPITVVSLFAYSVTTDPISLPQLLDAVPAGFPSPAQDYDAGPIDLTELLIEDQAATFLVRVSGTSMVDAGIHDGDVVIVHHDHETLRDQTQPYPTRAAAHTTMVDAWNIVPTPPGLVDLHIGSVVAVEKAYGPPTPPTPPPSKTD